jgi:hypothetical protein
MFQVILEKKIKNQPPDCREQFKLMKPKIIKRWITIAIVFIGGIPYMMFMQWLLGDSLSQKSIGLFVIMPYALIYLGLVFSLHGFTCPNCHKSLYVQVYLGRIPILVKTWVSRSCTHCGARLK